MIDLRNIAQKATNSCPTTINRTKIRQEDLGEDPISIIDVGFVVANGKRVPVLVCNEFHENYFFGGQAFMNIVDAWIEAYSGDVEALRGDLAKSPVKVKLKSVKTRSGNSFTQVIVI